jgi:hypothetical protein
VEIPVAITSLDRRHPFAAECVALVISPQGCGLRATQPLPLETPVMLSDLPRGATASARVASCLPLGKEGKYFLIGLSLYNPGNVWGIANPPEDWNCLPDTDASAAGKPAAPPVVKNKDVWPYNVFSGHTESPTGRK